MWNIIYIKCICYLSFVTVILYLYIIVDNVCLCMIDVVVQSFDGYRPHLIITCYTHRRGFWKLISIIVIWPAIMDNRIWESVFTLCSVEILTESHYVSWILQAIWKQWCHFSWTNLWILNIFKCQITDNIQVSL